MVVDDEKDILTMTAMALERYGYKVEAFNDPVEALQRFKDNPNDFSLVLTDIRMPVMDGIQLSAELLKIKQDVHILLMTAFDIDGFIFDKLPTIKKEDVLKKPFQPRHLCECVSRRLEKVSVSN